MMDLMLFSMFSIFFKTAQGKCTPIRILRSSSKGKSSFTAIQDSSKGDSNYVDIKTISVPLLL